DLELGADHLALFHHQQASSLTPLLHEPVEQQKIGIVDVCDWDHISVNIIGSIWMRVHQFDTRLRQLVRTHRDSGRGRLSLHVESAGGVPRPL
ncbi:hypothetical protein A1O1_07906, partial [Capronia coronata CBS 617.96]